MTNPPGDLLDGLACVSRLRKAAFCATACAAEDAALVRQVGYVNNHARRLQTGSKPTTM